jgi:hypothetical protein
VNAGDRDGLIARIRQVRRVAALRDQSGVESQGPPPSQLRALEMRVEHLEHLVEGLQDSVHRESERQAKIIAEIQAQIQPGAMSASLADDARQRGL